MYITLYWTIDLPLHHNATNGTYNDYSCQSVTLLLIILQVVLAGDPLQLGAVLTSKHSQRYGLDISLLERLTLLPLYSRDEQKYAHSGNYNPHLVCARIIEN